jgi:hypothetical protein
MGDAKQAGNRLLEGQCHHLQGKFAAIFQQDCKSAGAQRENAIFR